MNPSVVLVIPNLNGAGHLPNCLDSVAALDYPADQLETIVVDNGSSDGSLKLLRSRYPWVRVLPQARNLGFAEAVNVGARASRAECLAVANNDMRLDRAWLRELAWLYAPATGHTCVGGVILDWEGERVDFVSGYITFHGFAGQERFGEPLEPVQPKDGSDLPFACGGSMLIGRELFLDLGGFDPSFFAFLEDVDLGWRIWLAGDKVRLSARARSYHRHQATTGAFAPFQRLLLYERNAIRMLVKNLDEDNLARVLAPSLLLLIQRAQLASESDRAAFDPAAQSAAGEQVPREALAPLHAVSDVLGDLEGLLEERRRVQALRRRTDEEVFAVFGRPFFPARNDQAYLEASARLANAFGLDRLFAHHRGTKLLVVGSGRGTRAGEIARATARFVPTLYAALERKDAVDGVETVRVDLAELEGLVAESSAVVVEASADAAARVVARGAGPLILDVAGVKPGAVDPELLDADLLLCASEAERAQWQPVVPRDRVHVVDAPELHDSLEPLRSLIEEPWRARRWNGSRTEDLQRLLARWRTEYGVGRPARWVVARALWRSLPERVRGRLAKLERRP